MTQVVFEERVRIILDLLVEGSLDRRTAQFLLKTTVDLWDAEMDEDRADKERGAAP